MQARRQLGEFLRSRRSRLSPQEAGVPTYGGRRRVPGLRREELALLAGVSASYYARLEQGQATNASPEVLDALSRALRLDAAERRHLSGLAAAPRRPAVRRLPPERVDAAVHDLVAALGDVPVLVLGRRLDVLAWNTAGHALFAGHLEPDTVHRPDRRPNMARLVFLDAHTRELYVDWQAKARAVVATLRMASGQHPTDPLLAALVGELAVGSAEFAARWADHRVKAGGTATYAMRHPLVGTLTVTQQNLRTEDDQTVVVATTTPGSPSQAAMTLLVHATVTGRATARQPLPG
ncbi:transcriptional regulator [Micromonospora humidisoli]|uniref:helix-turn-helix domain-containing protein n=1 Tax=Micromonospora sp. AKA109 TaxID=2733865 RepID=UPI0022CB1CAF|nr:helix-turn-helix transcriptional regulator [Micromonospora sp. AKA109]GHJ09531.1 transcriptional regulator [Micromonospora sp. AKA109]